MIIKRVGSKRDGRSLDDKKHADKRKESRIAKGQSQRDFEKQRSS